MTAKQFTTFPMVDTPPTVLIADDHPLVREALQQVVVEAFPGASTIEASDLQSSISIAVGNDVVDLILLDLDMPGMEGFTGLVSLRNQLPATPVIIVSAENSHEAIAEAATLGAAGFIIKSQPRQVMVSALQRVMNGDLIFPDEQSIQETQPHSPGAKKRFQAAVSTLTVQQSKVLELLVKGMANKRIAYELGVTESTVKSHVSAILRKLKLNSRTQIALMISKLG
ncbi:MAG TPA: response regulator transcription factor [Arenicellales bacterium]|nr:response regulator transcription factor [Pseudomonadales bacterium]HJL53735.1 response regulator transcription factor [Arenicellales bacterium]